MVKKFQEEKAFTLLEVLLSIVLLAIILTSFLGFFTQSALFINRNEEKLTASQAAQKVVNILESDATIAKLKNYGILNDAGIVVQAAGLNELQLEALTGRTIDVPYPLNVHFSNNKGLVQAKVVIDPDGEKSETFTFIRW